MKGLKRLRETAGLTQWELSRAAKVDRSRLALAEVGQVILSAEQEGRVRRVLAREIRKRRDLLDSVIAKSQPAMQAATASV